jgi:SGNH hydrolase-like domain, acetyltransferase AlgX
MRFFRVFILLCLLQFVPKASRAEEISLSAAQTAFRADLANKFADLDKKNIGAYSPGNGWFFLASELRFLSLGQFWGEPAAKVSRSSKAEWADPLACIVDFQKQLKARGIDLLLAPVPPKGAVYPEKLDPAFASADGDAAPYLHRFYEELRSAGVDVLDLSETFRKNRENEHGPVYCKTDTHWSGAGCVLAAQAIAEYVRPKLPAQPKAKDYAGEWKETVVKGDLLEFLPSGAKPEAERLAIRSVSEKGTGAPVEADPSSPILLMGDSHTLVFHEFLAERAGLLDQLALEFGGAPDLIGTRGSGATPVRLSLYRRSLKDRNYLSRKKLVIWCFTAREFTEASQGWQKLQVAK